MKKKNYFQIKIKKKKIEKLYGKRYKKQKKLAKKNVD